MLPQRPHPRHYQGLATSVGATADRRLMAAKTAGVAVLAGVLRWIQRAEHRSFCLYRPIASLASFVAVPRNASETWAELKRHC